MCIFVSNFEIMERLKRLSNELIRRVPIEFARYINEEIDWDNQLIGVTDSLSKAKQ